MTNVNDQDLEEKIRQMREHIRRKQMEEHSDTDQQRDDGEDEEGDGG